MSSSITLNNELDISGTSFHGVYIKVKPSDLFLFFGEGIESDGYKVSKEYVFEYKGMVFTLYDWKSTGLYDERYRSPEEFWAQESVELHIGSRCNSGVEMEFKMALEAHLFNKVGLLVLNA